jgi:hypothetical protein
MAPRGYSLLVNLIVAVHIGIIAVVITPLVLFCAMQTPPRWVVVTTITATVLTIISYLFRRECLLNSLERLLRRKAGETDLYEGSFTEHYAKKIGITIPKGVISVTILASIVVSIYYVLK